MPSGTAGNARIAPAHGRRWVDARRGEERGALTLEACISVTIFTMLLLFIVSVFPMYIAQNAIAHALLQTTKSLSLDVYANEHLPVTKLSGVEGYASWKDANGKYTYVDKSSGNRWYRSSTVGGGYGDPASTTQIVSEVKKRFMYYLYDEGNTSSVSAYLNRLFVKNGMTGLDFSDTRISNNRLYVTLNYEYRNDFAMLPVWPIKATQTTCAHLWYAR